MKKTSTLKILLVFVFVLIVNSNLQINAQRSAPNYQSEIIWSDDSLKIDIYISIKKGKAPFNYQLYDKLPHEGGVILDEAMQVDFSNYTFSALEPKNYILIVSDKSGLKNGRNIYPKK